MKSVKLTFLVILFFNCKLFAQEDNTSTERQLYSAKMNSDFFTLLFYPKAAGPDKNYYLKKSRNQKKTGWILLGGGAAMVAAGTLIYNATKDDESTTSNSGVLLQVFGVASAIVSVPFFIRSSKNKKLAANITIERQKILLPVQDVFIVKNQPAFSFRISLK